LNWGNSSVHKLTVVFAYRYWQNNSIQQLGTNLLQYGISQVLQNIGGTASIADANLSTITQSVTPTSSGSTVQNPEAIGGYGS
jgi:hypothetical protein